MRVGNKIRRSTIISAEVVKRKPNPHIIWRNRKRFFFITWVEEGWWNIAYYGSHYYGKEESDVTTPNSNNGKRIPVLFVDGVPYERAYVLMRLADGSFSRLYYDEDADAIAFYESLMANDQIEIYDETEN